MSDTDRPVEDGFAEPTFVMPRPTPPTYTPEPMSDNYQPRHGFNEPTPAVQPQVYGDFEQPAFDTPATKRRVTFGTPIRIKSSGVRMSGSPRSAVITGVVLVVFFAWMMWQTWVNAGPMTFDAQTRLAGMTALMLGLPCIGIWFGARAMYLKAKADKVAPTSFTQPVHTPPPVAVPPGWAVIDDTNVPGWSAHGGDASTQMAPKAVLDNLPTIRKVSVYASLIRAVVAIPIFAVIGFIVLSSANSLGGDPTMQMFVRGILVLVMIAPLLSLWRAVNRVRRQREQDRGQR